MTGVVVVVVGVVVNVVGVVVGVVGTPVSLVGMVKLSVEIMVVVTSAKRGARQGGTIL